MSVSVSALISGKGSNHCPLCHNNFMPGEEVRVNIRAGDPAVPVGSPSSLMTELPFETKAGCKLVRLT